MKNFIRKGEKITVTGPSGGLSAGDPYMVGSIPCVCDVDIEAGATGTASTSGVFALTFTKSASDMTLGGLVYYTTATGVLAETSVGGVLFGYSLAATTGATELIHILVK